LYSSSFKGVYCKYLTIRSSSGIFLLEVLLLMIHVDLFSFYLSLDAHSDTPMVIMTVLPLCPVSFGFSWKWQKWEFSFLCNRPLMM
jgi:hypothetical protein